MISDEKYVGGDQIQQEKIEGDNDLAAATETGKASSSLPTVEEVKTNVAIAIGGDEEDGEDEVKNTATIGASSPPVAIADSNSDDNTLSTKTIKGKLAFFKRQCQSPLCLVVAILCSLVFFFIFMAYSRDKGGVPRYNNPALSNNNNSTTAVSSGNDNDDNSNNINDHTPVISTPQTSYLMTISSIEFGNGEPIPVRYTADGSSHGQLSPPIAWTNIPVDTKSLVLICEDPDAPSPANPAEDPYVHWIVYNIDPIVYHNGFDEGISRLNNDFSEGYNSFGIKGYQGPSPPVGSGKHRYFFKLYAINMIFNDLELEGLAAGDNGDGRITKDIIMNEIQRSSQTILQSANFMGTYERN